MKNRFIRLAALGVLALAATFGALQLGTGTAEAAVSGGKSCWRACVAMGGSYGFCTDYCGSPR